MRTVAGKHGLMNPRQGFFVRDSLEHLARRGKLCRAIGGSRVGGNYGASALSVDTP
jgi:hypothetical protein